MEWSIFTGTDKTSINLNPKEFTNCCMILRRNREVTTSTTNCDVLNATFRLDKKLVQEKKPKNGLVLYFKFWSAAFPIRHQFGW